METPCNAYSAGVHPDRSCLRFFSAADYVFAAAFYLLTNATRVGAFIYASPYRAAASRRRLCPPQLRRPAGARTSCLPSPTQTLSHYASVQMTIGPKPNLERCAQKEGWLRINKISRSHRKRRSRARSASATARSRNSGFPLSSQSENHPGLAVSGGFAIFF